MLSKSLIHFSLKGRGCVPSWLFDLRPNYGGSNEDNGDLFQNSHASNATLSAPNPASGLHHFMPLPHGQVWVSVLWGHYSFLLGPGAHKVLFVPSQSLFPQSCVSSGSSMVGQWRPPPRGLLPYPGLLHPEPLPLWQATAGLYLLRRHPNTVLSQSLWGLWVLVHTRYV